MKTINIISATLIFIFLSNANISHAKATGLVFRVQFNATELNLDHPLFNQYKPIDVQHKVGLMGEFKDYIVAQKAKSDAKEQGLYETEIVPFFNAEEISLNDALTLLDNRNNVDKKNLLVSQEKMDEMMAALERPEFFYTIHLGTFEAPALDNFLHLPKMVTETQTEIGMFRYTYGNYQSLEEAKAALGHILESDTQGAYIAAYDEVSRIPLATAQRYEDEVTMESFASVK